MSGSVLERRAQALARTLAQHVDGESIEVVTFVLAGEKYAVESDHVREIYTLRQWTRVPCTPPFILGIVNVRGQILTVLDIRKFFDLPLKALNEDSRVLIARDEDHEMGILADEVLGVRRVSRADLQAPPSALEGPRAAYLMGVTREAEGDWVAVLDVGKILSDEKIVVREDAGA